MGKIIRKDDLVDLLAEKTSFYKHNMREVVAALEEIILESLQSSTFEEDSELHLAKGFRVCARRVPEGEAKDPRTGEIIVSPEKTIPYAVFTQTFRKKLFEQPKTKKKGKKG